MTGPTWREVVDDRPQDRRFRVRRDIFSDPGLFAGELEALFEGGWVYLAHASQLPGPNDYVTTHMGRRPVVVMRGADGVARAFLNACPHKGAIICPLPRGNAPLHVCAYHSWSFASDGTQKAVKAKSVGGYTEQFLAERQDLTPIVRFAEYRGFYFGSLNSDVPTLEEYLGDAAFFIDLIVDQGPEGAELVPGVSAYTYRGNWKLQLENCSDGYHVTSVHPTYLAIAERRAREGNGDGVSGVWDRSSGSLEDTVGAVEYGSFRFANGHVAIWSAAPAMPGHPLFAARDELVARVGPLRARWMFYARNLTIFPNLQIADNFASQIRVIRPLAPDRTEMTTYCVGPRGEAAAARRTRLRQYEDFYNPSGMATPDDLIVYEACQMTDDAARDTWQSYERGMAVQQDGTNEVARELGIKPVASIKGPGQLWDETVLHAYYRAWSDRMARAEGARL